jgi:hypothetical protein
LNVIQSAAAEKIAVSRELHPSLIAIESRLEALRAFQVEITDLSGIMRSTEENARRSHENAVNVQSEESIEHRLLANQIQKANLSAIHELKTEFINKLENILRMDAGLRTAAVSKYVGPGRSIGEALITYPAMQDEHTGELRSRLAELEAEALD